MLRFLSSGPVSSYLVPSQLLGCISFMRGPLTPTLFPWS